MTVSFWKGLSQLDICLSGNVKYTYTEKMKHSTIPVQFVQNFDFSTIYDFLLSFRCIFVIRNGKSRCFTWGFSLISILESLQIVFPLLPFLLFSFFLVFNQLTGHLLLPNIPRKQVRQWVMGSFWLGGTVSPCQGCVGVLNHVTVWIKHDVAASLVGRGLTREQARPVFWWRQTSRIS